jgi:hypothetical protein
LAEKEKIIVEANQKIETFEKMQEYFDKRISAKKYLIGTKHFI